MGVLVLYFEFWLVSVERDILVSDNFVWENVGGISVLCSLLGSGAIGNMFLYVGAVVLCPHNPPSEMETIQDLYSSNLHCTDVWTDCTDYNMVIHFVVFSNCLSVSNDFNICLAITYSGPFLLQFHWNHSTDVFEIS